MTPASRTPTEADVLRAAFIRCLESVEYFSGQQPECSPHVADDDMARIKGEICRQLLRHPEAAALADDLVWRLAVKCFRELNVSPPPLDTNPDAVPHFTAVELSDARKRLMTGQLRSAREGLVELAILQFAPDAA